MTSTYMGVADPLLVRHEGAVFYDRASQRGPVRRVVDVHGASLSAYLGKGNKRVRFHNDLEATGAALATLVGFRARQQPADLFNSAINPAERRRFEGAQATSARQHRGGLVPDMAIDDFFLPSSPGVVPVLRMYDWKAVGRISKFMARTCKLALRTLARLRWLLSTSPSPAVWTSRTTVSLATEMVMSSPCSARCPLSPHSRWGPLASGLGRWTSSSRTLV
jgi:hypothetical protein